MNLPTSTIQQAIHDDERHLPGAHQVSFLLQLGAPVGPGRVAAALSALQARHALLRSTFHDEGGRCVRRVHAALPAELGYAATTRVGADLRVVESLQRPIDISVQPPFRPLVFVLPDGTTLLHLLLHHHVYDAVTTAVLMRELLVLLAGGELGAGWLDHHAFVEAEAAFDGGEACAAVARRLAGRPLRMPLPVVGRARVQRAARCAWVADDAAGPRALARFVAGWHLVLADWLGRDDLVLGTTASLRRRQLRNVFGPVFQYVPLAPEIVRGMPIGAAIDAARNDLRDALESAWVPLPAGTAGPHLGLNANLNFYDVDRFVSVEQRLMRRGGDGAFGGLAVRELPVPEAEVPRPYDLNLGITRAGGRFSAQLRYRPDLMDAAEARGLLDALGARLGLAA